MCQNSSLRLDNIPLYVYTTFCLPIYLLMDIWIASIPWLLRIEHGYTNKFLGSCFQFVWGWVQKIKLLAHMVKASILIVKKNHMQKNEVLIGHIKISSKCMCWAAPHWPARPVLAQLQDQKKDPGIGDRDIRSLMDEGA